MKRIMIYTNRKNRNSLNIISLLKDNSSFIMVFLLFLSGLVIGTTITYVFPLLQTFMNELFIISESAVSVFLRNFIFYNTNYIALFVFGLCSIGSPFILSIPLLSGAYYGSIFTVFYNYTDANGIVSFLLLKLPAAIIFIITVILATSISLQMSANLNTVAFLNSRTSVNLKNYLIKFIIILVFGLAAAITDVIVFILFNNFLSNYIE